MNNAILFSDVSWRQNTTQAHVYSDFNWKRAILHIQLFTSEADWIMSHEKVKFHYLF